MFLECDSSFLSVPGHKPREERRMAASAASVGRGWDILRVFNWEMLEVGFKES